MSYCVEYYNKQVLAEIEEWPISILADYARLLELLMAHGPNLRMPHSKPLGDGLFELRPKGKAGIGRVLYCYQVGQKIVILHVFIKKTQQTPARDLALARKRVAEVKNGYKI
jgi:phage-related protein